MGGSQMRCFVFAVFCLGCVGLVKSEVNETCPQGYEGLIEEDFTQLGCRGFHDRCDEEHVELGLDYETCCPPGESCSYECAEIDTKIPKCTIPCETNQDCMDFADNLRCYHFKWCQPKSYLWVVGVCLFLAGSLVSNFGMQFQKMAFNKESERQERENDDKKRKAIQLPLWWAGFAGMFTGSMLDFGSLGFASQSTLAPLASSTLVINLFFSPIINGEQLTRIDVIATFVISLGCTVSVVFADHNNTTHSLEDMYYSFQRPIFICYVCCVFMLMACGYLVILDGKRVEPNGQIKMMNVKSKRYPLLFSFLGGMNGGNSILFAKACSEIGKSTFQIGISELFHPFNLLMVIGVFASLLTQVNFLNAGLRTFDVLIILPVYQAFWIISSALNGMLFFMEYRDFDTVSYILFPLGIAVTLSGVACLTLKFDDDTMTAKEKDIQLARQREQMEKIATAEIAAVNDLGISAFTDGFKKRLSEERDRDAFDKKMTKTPLKVQHENSNDEEKDMDLSRP